MVEQNPAGAGTWMIYALFLIAGLFVGGAWSAYKSKNVPLTVLAGAVAVVAAAGGVLWMMGDMA